MSFAQSFLLVFRNAVDSDEHSCQTRHIQLLYIFFVVS